MYVHLTQPFLPVCWEKEGGGTAPTCGLQQYLPHTVEHMSTPCLIVLFIECARGFLSSDTVNMYGPGSRSAELPSTTSHMLYIFPSMNFSCNGTITNIRMRMDFIEGLRHDQRQVVLVYFLLFHDRLNSPTRQVTHILLNRNNTQQYFDHSAQKFTEIWQTQSLALHVREGAFIGFAVPANDSIEPSTFHQHQKELRHTFIS